MEIRNILWLTDFNPLSNYAFEWAKFFSISFKTKLYAVHVIPEKKISILEEKEEILNMFNLMEREERKKAEKDFESKKKEIDKKIEFETHLLKGEIVEEIIKFINEKDIDLLIMGASNKREKLMIGTTAYRILTNARIPVLVVKEKIGVKVNKILVPIDFSKLSFKALDYAIFLAEIFGSEIHLLHVIEILESIGLKEVEEKLIEETKEMLHRESEKFKGKYRIFVNAIKRDSAEIGIIEFAEEKGIDLICMATRGRKGISHFFLGSTLDKVLKLTDIPILAFNPV
ncbi:MAG: universal stress protein [candidate division WOR-3 bacterium]